MVSMSLLPILCSSKAFLKTFQFAQPGSQIDLSVKLMQVPDSCKCQTHPKPEASAGRLSTALGQSPPYPPPFFFFSLLSVSLYLRVIQCGKQFPAKTMLMKYAILYQSRTGNSQYHRFYRQIYFIFLAIYASNMIFNV